MIGNGLIQFLGSCEADFYLGCLNNISLAAIQEKCCKAVLN